MKDTRKFFLKKKTINENNRKQIKLLSRNTDKRNHKIWGVCHYLKTAINEGCRHCPEWEIYMGGPCQRMCYGLAEECMKVGTGEWPVDNEGNIISKYISRTIKVANTNPKKITIRMK